MTAKQIEAVEAIETDGMDSGLDTKPSSPNAPLAGDGGRTRSFSIGRENVQLPADIPEPNDLVRAVFATHEKAEALLFVFNSTALYLLPWSCRNGGVAGYEQELDTFHVRPVEVRPDEVRTLIAECDPNPVELSDTPAWLLVDAGVEEVRVTWHARVRWGERVAPSPDPAPKIRDAWRRGVSIGVDHGTGRYYPPENVVLVAVDDPPQVTTVYEPETWSDLGTDHLVDCPHCGELCDPAAPDSCACCEGPVCPWCKGTVAN